MGSELKVLPIAVKDFGDAPVLNQNAFSFGRVRRQNCSGVLQ